MYNWGFHNSAWKFTRFHKILNTEIQLLISNEFHFG
jgi:hypothetical protein